MKKTYYLSLIFILSFVFQLTAQITNEVKWDFEVKKIATNEYDLYMNAKIDAGWHLYSLNNKSDDPTKIGPNPIYFEFEKNNAYKLIGDVKEVSKAHVVFEKLFDMETAYFTDKAVFVQKVKTLKAIKEIKAFTEYQICDDKACKYPLSADFNFAVSYEEESTEVAESEEADDAMSFDIGNKQSQQKILDPVKWNFELKKISKKRAELIITAEIGEGWHLYSAYVGEGGPKPSKLFFDENQNIELIDSIIESGEKEDVYDSTFEMPVSYFGDKVVFIQKIKLDKKNQNISGSFEYMVCNDNQCVSLTEDFQIGEKDEAADLATTGEKGEKSLLMFFILAFLGGLAAIVMPCVFPMIPMTVSFFMHSSDKKSKAKSQALFFSLSIIGIYTAFGLIVSATLGPDFINWLSTHWIPNIFFTLIFLFFAASFFGMFEITLPSWMINKSDKQADKGGYFGAFFMAFTLVLVSFSCTVPIVGLILVEAARGEIIKPIIGMLGFSLAFALPFGFFAFFPSKLGNLPKSGGWLNSVKVVFGFIELALALKFLMVADQTYHWGILPREVYIAFWVVIFALLGFYLLGKLKFAHDSDLPFISVPRLTMAILSFTFVVYLIPGLIGAPLKGMSGYLPPQESHSFDLNSIVRGYTKGLSVEKISFNDDNKTLCTEPKYSDILHLPHGLEGYFDFEQGLACAKEQGKPLFIDFTGHGCVNCREMEQSVWVNDMVLKRLKSDWVVMALYVDDKTKLPEEEWEPSRYNGKLMKSIGKRNADIQITQFGSNSQPNYILLDTDGKTVLATPRGHDKDVDAFVEFLDEGLKNFKARHPEL